MTAPDAFTLPRLASDPTSGRKLHLPLVVRNTLGCAPKLARAGLSKSDWISATGTTRSRMTRSRTGRGMPPARPAPDLQSGSDPSSGAGGIKVHAKQAHTARGTHTRIARQRGALLADDRHGVDVCDAVAQPPMRARRARGHGVMRARCYRYLLDISRATERLVSTAPASLATRRVCLRP